MEKREMMVTSSNGGKIYADHVSADEAVTILVGLMNAGYNVKITGEGTGL